VPKADILRCGKERRYSITSSAIASSGGGTFKPWAFAVFRLITKSNLVGTRLIQINERNLHEQQTSTNCNADAMRELTARSDGSLCKPSPPCQFQSFD